MQKGPGQAPGRDPIGSRFAPVKKHQPTAEDQVRCCCVACVLIRRVRVRQRAVWGTDLPRMQQAGQWMVGLSYRIILFPGMNKGHDRESIS